MNHLIYVVPAGSEHISTEIPLNLKAADLLPIMGWEDEHECVYDYLLTPQRGCTGFCVNGISVKPTAADLRTGY